MCHLVVEHGLSLRLLVAHGNLTSAIVLLRVQLDAVIRLVWIHYAADQAWVQSVMTHRPENGEKDPTQALAAKTMLKEIQERAPPELHRQLSEFKEAAWPALNSYVHSGIWPLVQRVRGNEIEGAIQTLKNSMGLTCMAAMMIAMHTGDRQNTLAVKFLQLKHRECLPPILEVPPSSAG